MVSVVPGGSGHGGTPFKRAAFAADRDGPSIDLVVLDWDLAADADPDAPEGDVLGAAAAAGVPCVVIAAAADATPGAEEAALRRGASAFVARPMRAGTLLTALRLCVLRGKHWEGILRDQLASTAADAAANANAGIGGIAAAGAARGAGSGAGSGAGGAGGSIQALSPGGFGVRGGAFSVSVAGESVALGDVTPALEARMTAEEHDDFVEVRQLRQPARVTLAFSPPGGGGGLGDADGGAIDDEALAHAGLRGSSVAMAGRRMVVAPGASIDHGIDTMRGCFFQRY